jgi:hypothetical protein
MTTMTFPRYYKICRFTNEASYIKIDTPAQADKIEAAYCCFAHEYPSGYATWTSDQVAREPGVASTFADWERAQP